MLAFEGIGPAEKASGIRVVDMSIARGAELPASATHQKIVQKIVDQGRDFAWSPSAQGAFLYDRPPQSGGSDDQESTLWIQAGPEAPPEMVCKGWMGAWSPDGRKIAFVHSGGVHVIDTITGKKHCVLEGTTKNGRMDWIYPSWSPTGKWIAAGGSADGRIRIVSPDGSQRKAVTKKTPSCVDMEPVFSPDGSRICWVRAYDTGVLSSDATPHPVFLTHQLWVAKVTGEDARPITKWKEGTSCTCPQWLRSGKEIAYLEGGRLAFLEISD
jgi:Tol biopolymer transport system component